jgi:hypothetical protein
MVIQTTTGDEMSAHVVNHWSCISVTGALIEVKKPDGESFAARGRYKLERGFRRGGFMRQRGSGVKQDEAADTTVPFDGKN